MPRSKDGRQKRKAKQQRVKRYSKAREDCQLNGDIETEPAGAVCNEVVDPSTQGSQPLPGLIGRGIRSGWEPTEEMKVRMTDELFDIATDQEVEPHVRVAAVRASQQGSQQQWERDNPELAGKTKGGTKVDVNTTVNNQLTLLDIANAAMDRVDPEQEAMRKAVDGGTRKSEDGTGPIPESGSPM